MSQITPRRRIHTLSFAIALKDGYSKDTIKGGVKILLNGQDFNPVINPDSYYTFLNLPDGTYTVRAIDESKKYFDGESEIQVPVVTGVRDKLFEISLLPRPYYYTFPPGETLLHGTLRPKNGQPISGAILSSNVSAGVFSSKTDEIGRFVVYFGVLAYKDIVTWNDKDYIKGTDQDNPRDIDILIRYPVDGSRAIMVHSIVSDIEVGVNNIRDLEVPSSTILEGIHKDVPEDKEILISLKGKIASMESSYYNDEGFPEFL